MFIKKPDGPLEITEIYPFVDGELDRTNFLTPRIEVFPKGYEDSLHSTKRVRFNGDLWTRDEWANYMKLINEGMEIAFAMEDVTAKEGA